MFMVTASFQIVLYLNGNNEVNFKSTENHDKQDSAESSTLKKKPKKNQDQKN